jgi:hypothetical protein
MFTEHSYFVAPYGTCAGVLKRVIQAVPEDPLEVEVRSKATNFKPILVPYGTFDPASLGQCGFLSGVRWKSLKGMRARSAWIYIKGDGSHFMTYNSHSNPLVCYVGPLSNMTYEDDPSEPYLQVTNEGALEMLLTRLIL